MLPDRLPAQTLAAEYHRAAGAAVAELQATLTEAAGALKAAHAEAAAAEADVTTAAEAYSSALADAGGGLDEEGDAAVTPAPLAGTLAAVSRKCASEGEAKLTALRAAHEADARKTYTQLSTVVAQVRALKRGKARTSDRSGLSMGGDDGEGLDGTQDEDGDVHMAAAGGRA